jgi:hypothetical protein
LKVNVLEELLMAPANENILVPQNFKELQKVVVQLAKNEVQRFKETKTLTDVIVQQSKDISDLKQKVNK